ncbi:MAG: radical SAM protein [Elusimicrobia bacterium]|nr:radical SAM protein [Elusimicrobiota bacterium]
MSPDNLDLLPTSLEIYLTTACNLRCRYCSSRAIMGGRPRGLSFAQAARAADIFLAQAFPRSAGRDPSPLRTIGITGGEPFVEFPLLARLVDHIQGRNGRAAIDVVTNGTLLDRAKAGFLLDRGVDLAVSLDGDAATTGRNRRFADGRGRPVFAHVLARLEALTPAQRRGLCAMTTFPSATVGRVVESIALLRSFGFKEIVLDLDMYERWSPRKLPRLRAALAGLRGYYVREMRASSWPHASGKLFGFAFENKLGAARPFPPPSSFSLSPDGWFFPSDVLGAHRIRGRDYRVGDLRRGIDFPKLRRIYSELGRFLRAGRLTSWVLPPVERYFFALSRGLDPLAMTAADESVARVFAEELGPFVDIERILSDLAREPGFGDFQHRPSRVCPRPVRRLELDARRLGLAALRRLADYCLYSPGRDKELLLRLDSLSRDRRTVEALTVYCLLKSRKLGKRLRLALEGRPDGAGVPWRLLRDWDVFVGARAASTNRRWSQPRFLREDR